MHSIDKQYTDLLKDILENGVSKTDRTGTGTISVFGRQIRHRMSEGFPLLTTKKMYFKGIVTELLWFLRGDTNIKYLLDNDCHIWDGDAYKNWVLKNSEPDQYWLTKEEFINKIKTDDEFAKKWGELGPIYGKQWRGFSEIYTHDPISKIISKGVDQIAGIIEQLKDNPDSRRMIVTAWNPNDLEEQVLPPCHYGFQIYTRELSVKERMEIYFKQHPDWAMIGEHSFFDNHNIPTRAISLMWNQRSVDTFLGLPFNIASYGLLLEIIAKAVNMVPDELIGNLGDTHLYSNHIEQAKEQIGRELTFEERTELYNGPEKDSIRTSWVTRIMDEANVPKRTREPYPLPKLNINTEFWPTESGECGEGPLDAMAVLNGFSNDDFCKCLLEEDIQLGNYQSHPTIKAPLSN